MGDDCCNPDSMGRVMTLIDSHIKGSFVYSIQVGKNVDSDHKAGFFGKIDEQVDQVCDELSKIPQLAEGFHAIGFSQVKFLKKKNYKFIWWLTYFYISHYTKKKKGWIVFKVKEKIAFFLI